MKNLFAVLVLGLAVASAQNALHVDLSQGWHRSVTDSPDYARPDFDDRSWDVVSLPSPNPVTSSRVMWLRRSVDLPAGTDHRQLALTLGAINDAYEVYINGINIGRTGGWTVADWQISRPRTFLIPPPAAADAPRLQIAIRSQRLPRPRSPVFGLISEGPFLLTYASNQPRNLGPQSINNRRLQNAPSFLLAVLELFLGISLLLVWAGQRNRYHFLWLSAFLLLESGGETIHYLVIREDSFPLGWPQISNTIARTAGAAAYAEFAISALLVRARWLRAGVWLIWAAFVLTLVTAGIGLPWYFPALRVLYGVTLLVIAIHWWQKRHERQILSSHAFVFTVALLALAEMNQYGSTLGLPRSFSLGPFAVPLHSLLILILSISLLGQMLREVVIERREKRRLTTEFEAARGVQKLLFSGVHPPSPGYTIDAVYQPALEVGGDFYLVLPSANGTTLVVVGDVSGKGLKAALVVSLMTGVARAHAALPPAALLAEMNRVLGLDSGGFVTCLAIRCASGGLVTLANAGHLAPYRQGAEVAVEAGLPLGILLDTDYAETRLQIGSGEAIAVVTDGVVEAENAQRELFGFDRTREISGKSSAEIAEAAKAWGQNDDITVVTVRRVW